MTYENLPPAVVALMDQAEAAAEDALCVFFSIGASSGAHVGYLLPTTNRAMTRLHERFRTHVAGHDARMVVCEHLSLFAPSVSFWLPWAPEKVRCSDCAKREIDRIRGTAEDKRCDLCGRVATQIHRLTGFYPPIVANDPIARPWATPPVVMIAGVCPRCSREALGVAPKPVAEQKRTRGGGGKRGTTR